MADKSEISDAAPGERWSTVWVTVIAALMVYLLPLVALVVDELVLKTFWISRTAPRGARDVFFMVYPFLKFLK
jgi:hypothetical protein